VAGAPAPVIPQVGRDQILRLNKWQVKVDVKIEPI